MRALAAETRELIADTEKLVTESRSAAAWEDIPGLKQGIALTVEKLSEIGAALAAFRITEQAFAAVRRSERERLAVGPEQGTGAGPPPLRLVAGAATAPSRRRRRGGASAAPAAG